MFGVMELGGLHDPGMNNHAFYSVISKSSLFLPLEINSTAKQNSRPL